jgi:hypothetical protein
MVECSKCIFFEDRGDEGGYCTKGIYEEHPYQPIEECEYFEAKNKMPVVQQS